MKGPKHLKIVIKIGSSSIVDEKTHEPILPILTLIVDTAIKLRREGHKVIIVSSGAIAVGLQRMDIAIKPKPLPKKQALAAIGQCRLISIWDSLFAHMRQPIAQILLTRNDIADHQRYINAQNTIREVLEYDAIPIINENDTLAVSEIKFGDNDTLSAIAAGMVHADYLFLMTDVEALYDKNPRLHADAQPIETVPDIDALKVDVSSRGSSLGTGGMATKITAARLATSAGTTTIITKSSKPGNIKDIINYLHPSSSSAKLSNESATLSQPPLHTRFLPSSTRVRDRAFWIRHGLAPKGTIYIDRGASEALKRKAGLFPAGIVDVEGDFGQQEAVRLVIVDRHHHHHLGSLSHFNNTLSDDFSTSTTLSSGTVSTIATPPDLSRASSQQFAAHASYTIGEEIGRAITEYSAEQIQLIRGLKSSDISKILGYADSEYVALRSNISLNIEAFSQPQTPRPGSYSAEKRDEPKEGSMSGSGLLERVIDQDKAYTNGSVTPPPVDGHGFKTGSATPDNGVGGLKITN